MKEEKEEEECRQQRRGRSSSGDDRSRNGRKRDVLVASPKYVEGQVDEHVEEGVRKSPA